MADAFIRQLLETHHYAPINAGNLDEFLSQSGDLLLFVTGNPERNLETNDVAIILPQLDKAFKGHFKIGIVMADAEKKVQQKFDVWPTPCLLFINNGALIHSIPKVQDWADYIKEISGLLSKNLSVN